jgi:23S rRNA (cytosine1962-C5)-methyltransferase
MHGSLARHALRLLSPGGVLVQACCSQAIRMEQLEDAILQAAAREGVALHLLHRLSQPPDHPILAGHPASEYLKGVVLRRS